MTPSSDSFAEGGRIAGEIAFVVIDPVHHVKRSRQAITGTCSLDSRPAAQEAV